VSILDSLYQEAILGHYKKPRNHGVLEPHDVREEGVNPSCGDEVTLYLKFGGDVITGVSFEGEGCAISQASASMLTDAVAGLSRAEALALSERFRAMLHGAEPAPELGELAVLRGVAKLPARVKCAALPFTTLEVALAHAGS
jgi:nitrogen fixation NifU-like protein